MKRRPKRERVPHTLTFCEDLYQSVATAAADENMPAVRAVEHGMRIWLSSRLARRVWGRGMPRRQVKVSVNPPMWATFKNAARDTGQSLSGALEGAVAMWFAAHNVDFDIAREAAVNDEEKEEES